MYVILLLCAFKSIRWHSQCAHPGVLAVVSVTRRGIGSGAQATIALFSVDNTPVGIREDSVVAIAS